VKEREIMKSLPFLGNDYHVLSLFDLLVARELYHNQLLRKENVVATALGFYRIRRNAPWPAKGSDDGNGASTKKGPKTLGNTEVRKYSWPCLLVFVDEWVEPSRFGHTKDSVNLGDFVPPMLNLPDGRQVPVCVIEAPLTDAPESSVEHLNYPQNVSGGGYPLLADVQMQERVASVGGLVSDGHLIYAMTNRHVAGQAGERIYSMLNGRKEEIGRSSANQLTRLRFEEVYDGLPGKEVFVNLDIGLIEVNDLNRWTAQIYGIGEIGKMVDLSATSMSLGLIDCPVRAYGAVSRQMRGRIAGLFYRYKSAGGFEYMADFLIGPDKNTATLNTHHGDSGTWWLLDTGDKELPRPLAIQWGGHVFVDSGNKTTCAYALATCLSTVCNILNVDVIRDVNIGLPDYWGAVGHYTIANKACAKVRNSRLAGLMEANLDRISFQVDQISKKNLAGLSNHEFVPLADVPDLVWKRGAFNRGGPEHPNHFADMDKPLPDGTTLLEMCKGKPDNVNVTVWQQYYDKVGDASRGLLPFRVWQFYKEMVQFVQDGDLEKFVCAAGILSHYVGDACQPLHISYMFNGKPGSDGYVAGQGVHAAYEDNMVDYHVAEIMAGTDNALKKAKAIPTITGGHQAAVATVELMQRTFDTIAPSQIVDEFVQLSGRAPREIADGLWEKFGDDTIQIMADGSMYLAMLWESAWQEGNGDQNIRVLGAVDQGALERLYQDKTFLKSFTLDHIGPELQEAPGVALSGPADGGSTSASRAGSSGVKPMTLRAGKRTVNVAADRRRPARTGSHARSSTATV
jgi:hypothetical protein